MKRLLSTLLLIISIHTTHAQFGENHAIYTTGGLNFGNYFGINANIDYAYQEKFSFKIGYSVYFQEPDSKPDDFSLGLFDGLSFGLVGPYNHLESYQVMAGRIYKFNPSGTIRLNMSVGLGLTKIKEPTNWQQINGSLFTRNYIWDYNEHNTISFIINPKIEFPFTRYYGLTISPILQINKDRTYFGIGVEQMIGLLRKRNK